MMHVRLDPFVLVRAETQISVPLLLGWHVRPHRNFPYKRRCFHGVMQER